MGLQILQIIGKETTDLYPLTHSLIEQLDKKLINLVVQWHVMGFGGELIIKKHDGTLISYQGIAFSGSPVTVFWGSWMSDYLKNDSLELLNKIAENAQKANYNVKKCVDEAVELLCIMTSRVYDKMADVDSKLQGDGITFGKLRDVSAYKSNFQKFITPHGKILVDKFCIQSPKEAVNNHQQDLFEAKPGFLGFRINLIEGYRRARKYFKRKTGTPTN